MRGPARLYAADEAADTDRHGAITPLKQASRGSSRPGRECQSLLPDDPVTECSITDFFDPAEPTFEACRLTAPTALSDLRGDRLLR